MTRLYLNSLRKEIEARVKGYVSIHYNKHEDSAEVTIERFGITYTITLTTLSQQIHYSVKSRDLALFIADDYKKFILKSFIKYQKSIAI